jgi:hypothetical protein
LSQYIPLVELLHVNKKAILSRSNRHQSKKKRTKAVKEKDVHECEREKMEKN